MTSISVPSITRLDYNIWRQYSGLPEVYDARYKQATSPHFALRPGKYPCSYWQVQSFIDCPCTAEFVESTWYLYRVRLFLYSMSLSQRASRRLVTLSTSTSGNELFSTFLPALKLTVASQVFRTFEPIRRTIGWNPLFCRKR